jgi:hypothetical protein
MNAKGREKALAAVQRHEQMVQEMRKDGEEGRANRPKRLFEMARIEKAESDGVMRAHHVGREKAIKSTRRGRRCRTELQADLAAREEEKRVGRVRNPDESRRRMTILC